MSNIDYMCALPPARAFPNLWVIVKYTNEGWFPGRLSSDMKTVAIEGASYDFDAGEDEFVEFTANSRAFLQRHPDSVLVRLKDMEYLIFDPKMPLHRVITGVNAVRNASNQKLLPALEKKYEAYSIEDAAALCSPPILALEVT